MDNFAKNLEKPSKEEMAKANVNPKTGLATDYLNLFNEYIMLCEAVIDGALEKEELNEWQARDYESHFIQTNFAGVKTVIAAYRYLDRNIKRQFDEAADKLIGLIEKHKENPFSSLDEIKHQRDLIETMIVGAAPLKEDEFSHAQEEIDALFD